MAFLFYFAVLLFAAASAMFGLDLMTAPLPQKHHHPRPQVADTATPGNVAAPAKAQGTGQAKKTAARDDDKAKSGRALSPVHPAAPGAPKSEVRTVYPPSNPALAAVVAQQNQANDAAKKSAQPQQQNAAQSEENSARAEATGSVPGQQASAPDGQVAAQPAAPETSNRCNVQACASAYQSFRASDCTYQPYEGPRKLCVKGGSSPRRAASQQPRRGQAQDRSGRQTRRDTDREAALRDADRRVRATRNRDDGDYYYYNDAPMFAGRGRRVIVVPDDRYRGFFR